MIVAGVRNSCDGLHEGGRALFHIGGDYVLREI
jgi:hypothetical protein